MKAGIIILAHNSYWKKDVNTEYPAAMIINEYINFLGCSLIVGLNLMMKVKTVVAMTVCPKLAIIREI